MPKPVTTGKPVAPPVKPVVPAKPVTTPVKPVAKETVTITKKDVGTIPAGLVKGTVAKPSPTPSSAVSVPLPGFLKQVAMPATSNRMNMGYVGFASTQSKKWSLMQQAGLEEGQPYIFHQQAYIPIDQLEFFLCLSTSYQSMMAGKNGTFIFATADMNEQVEQRIYQNQVVKAEPHYVCLILANLNGIILPIKGDFRGTKSGGMENAIRAVEAAADPDWLKLSDAHKATAAFPEPWGRVYHTITTKRGVSKSNGNPFFAAQCVSNPTTVTHMQLLVSHLKNEEFQNLLNESHTNYNGRIDFMNKICSGEIQQQQATPAVDPVTGDPVPF